VDWGDINGCIHGCMCTSAFFSRVHSVADSSTHGSFSFMFEIFPLATAAYPFVKIVGNISTSLRFLTILRCKSKSTVRQAKKTLSIGVKQ
jgi:hypothetical protein